MIVSIKNVTKNLLYPILDGLLGFGLPTHWIRLEFDVPFWTLVLRTPGCENERVNPLWVSFVSAGGWDCICWWTSESDNSDSEFLSRVSGKKNMKQIISRLKKFCREWNWILREVLVTKKCEKRLGKNLYILFPLSTHYHLLTLTTNQ